MNCNGRDQKLINGSAASGTAPFLNQVVSKRPNPEIFLPIPKLQFKTAAAIVFIVSVLCFCVSYDGDFVYDDKRAILENRDVSPDTPLANLFINDFWGERMDSRLSHKSYRPLTVWTFRMSYSYGGLSTPWFHVPNIILHGVIAVLLLFTFSILFGGYELDPDSEKIRFKAPKSALICAVLFSVHPIHTESVAANVGRADLLCALLFLLSFLLYIKSCADELTETDKKLFIFRPSSFSVPYMLGSMILCFLSVLCKEQGITVLGVCSAFDIIMVCSLDPLQLFFRRKPETVCKRNGPTSDKNNNLMTLTANPWVLSLIKRHVSLLTTGLLIIAFRWWIMSATQPDFIWDDNPHSFLNGSFTRAVNYNYIYSLNAWILISPWWLCFDWSMGCVPVIESVTDARILGGVAVWTVLGAIIFQCLKTQTSREQRILSLAVAFVIISFLPASNVFFRVGFVVAERVLYLPSIGFCMLIVIGIRQICTSCPKYAQVVQFTVVFLFCVFIARCIQRSSQWRNSIELFKAAELVCPLNAKVHFNMGKAMADRGNSEYAIEKYRLAVKIHPEYPPALNNLGLKIQEKGEYDEAERVLRRAIEIKINPTYTDALNNMGNLLRKRGEYDEAERYLKRAIFEKNDFAAAWMNLGLVKWKQKKHTEAEKCYFTALVHEPNYPQCLNNLANLYLDMNMFDKAVEGWINATLAEPTLSFPWINLISQLQTHGRYDESIAFAIKALQHLPPTADIYYYLGLIYGKQGKRELSEKNFLRAIELNPTKSLYYNNVGVLYQQWKKYDLAEQYYRTAFSLNPNEPDLVENIAKLQKSRELLMRQGKFNMLGGRT